MSGAIYSRVTIVLWAVMKIFGSEMTRPKCLHCLHRTQHACKQGWMTRQARFVRLTMNASSNTLVGCMKRYSTVQLLVNTCKASSVRVLIIPERYRKRQMLFPSYITFHIASRTELQENERRNCHVANIYY